MEIKPIKTEKDYNQALKRLEIIFDAKSGSAEGDELDSGYENFKIGAMIHDARLEKGLTQEQLAEKTGTTKSYISKIENNVKEARFSTLQKIVELGLGGHLELSIKL